MLEYCDEIKMDGANGWSSFLIENEYDARVSLAVRDGLLTFSLHHFSRVFQGVAITN